MHDDNLYIFDILESYLKKQPQQYYCVAQALFDINSHH